MPVPRFARSRITARVARSLPKMLDGPLLQVGCFCSSSPLLSQFSHSYGRNGREARCGAVPADAPIAGVSDKRFSVHRKPCITAAKAATPPQAPNPSVASLPAPKTKSRTPSRDLDDGHPRQSGSPAIPASAKGSTAPVTFRPYLTIGLAVTRVSLTHAPTGRIASAVGDHHMWPPYTGTPNPSRRRYESPHKTNAIDPKTLDPDQERRRLQTIPRNSEIRQKHTFEPRARGRHPAAGRGS